MQKNLRSTIIPTGLAIFSMLFGAGNLMYPIMVGMLAGDKNIFGIAGFLLTAVCLPVAGLIAMILFNGDYHAFFRRLGDKTGAFLTLVCMLVIGPIIALPRIVTLSHTMIAPFIPISFLNTVTPLSSFVFCLVFLGITFLATYKENKIVDVLGNVISPLLLISLMIIIVKGMLSGEPAVINDISNLVVFKENLVRGYETLDLLGGIFFASIVLNILKNTLSQKSPKYLASVGLKASLIGVTLLGLVYVGMSYLGVHHGYDLAGINAGELFREISFRILGGHGAAIIATAVLMACLSTSIALSAVVAEYLQAEVFKKNIKYVTALILVMLATIPLSTAGLGHVLALTGGPLTYIGYPMLIAVTFCNIGYKLFGIKTIRIPVALTFVVSLLSYMR